MSEPDADIEEEWEEMCEAIDEKELGLSEDEVGNEVQAARAERRDAARSE